MAEYIKVSAWRCGPLSYEVGGERGLKGGVETGDYVYSVAPNNEEARVVSKGGLPEKPVTGNVRLGMEGRVWVEWPKSITRIMLV